MPHQQVPPSYRASTPDHLGPDSDSARNSRDDNSSAPQPAGKEAILASLQDAIAVSTSDLDTILGWIAQAAQKFTGAEGVALAIRRDGAIICCARSGEMAPGLGARLSVDSGFSGACLIVGRPVRCDDTFADTRVDLEVCQRMGLRAIAAVPLRSPYGVTGLLEAFSSQPGAFTGEHVGLLERLAELAEKARVREAVEPPAQPTYSATAAESNLPVEPVTLAPQAVTPVAGRKAGPYWMIGAGLVVAVSLLLLGWTLSHRPAGTPVTAVAAAQPAVTAEAAVAPATTAPSALKPSGLRPGGQASSNGSRASLGLQPASQVQVEVGPRVVVPTTAESSNAPEATSPPGVKPAESGVVSDVEPPQIAAIAGKEPLGLMQGVAAMPALGVPTSQLSPGILVHQVQPTYPIQAMPLRLEGPVVMEGVVGADGRIHNLKVLSGHPILARAATDAVGQWRYQPFLLNGKPVPMETRITVKFTIP